MTCAAPIACRAPPRRPLIASMATAAIAVRWLYATGAISLVGVFASLVLVARPAARAAGDLGRERLRELDGRLLALGGAALAVTFVAGALDLWRQVGVATGSDARESLALDRLLSVLVDTRYGTVWLARMGLLALLAALLVLPDDRERDWLALRLQALALALASLVLGAMAGHAASAEGSTLAMALDALHVLATGVWAGGLVPLAISLAWSRGLPSPAAAATAAERFSRVGLGAVTVLGATGLYAAWQQVGRGARPARDRVRALASAEADSLRRAPSPGGTEPSLSGAAGSRRRVLRHRRRWPRSGATCCWKRRWSGRSSSSWRYWASRPPRSTTRSRGRCRSVSTGQPPRRFPGSSLGSRSEARWRPLAWWPCCWRWSSGPDAGAWPRSGGASGSPLAPCWRSGRWPSTRTPRPTCDPRSPIRPPPSSRARVSTGRTARPATGSPAMVTGRGARASPARPRTSRPSTRRTTRRATSSGGSPTASRARACRASPIS